MLTLNFNPFPVLTTERLVLRSIRHSDRDDFFAIRSNPDTMRYIRRPMALVPADVEPVIQLILDGVASNGRIHWAITEKGIGRLIGLVGYSDIDPVNRRCDVGYMLNKEHERKGIMQEALKAVMHYGFSEMNLHSIEAVIQPANIASCRLAEKCGFTRDAYFKDYKFYNGQFTDAVIYSFVHTGP